jgi:hypothetical protein
MTEGRHRPWTGVSLTPKPTAPRKAAPGGAQADRRRRSSVSQDEPVIDVSGPDLRPVHDPQRFGVLPERHVGQTRERRREQLPGGVVTLGRHLLGLPAEHDGRAHVAAPVGVGAQHRVAHRYDGAESGRLGNGQVMGRLVLVLGQTVGVELLDRRAHLRGAGPAARR